MANTIKEEKLVDVINYAEVENFMLNWFTKCTVNYRTMEIGKQLKQKGYNIYILSNMSKAAFEYFSKKYEFFTIVDGTIVSAYEGIKKPDLKIYELLLDIIDNL